MTVIQRSVARKARPVMTVDQLSALSTACAVTGSGGFVAKLLMPTHEVQLQAISNLDREPASVRPVQSLSKVCSATWLSVTASKSKSSALCIGKELRDLHNLFFNGASQSAAQCPAHRLLSDSKQDADPSMQDTVRRRKVMHGGCLPQATLEDIEREVWAHTCTAMRLCGRDCGLDYTRLYNVLYSIMFKAKWEQTFETDDQDAS